MKKKIRYWFPTVLWFLVIFMFSTLESTPSNKIIWWDFLIKKTAHITEYAILATLLFRSLKQSFSINKSLVFTFLICVLYAVSDEYHQSFVPGRHPKVYDVMFDTIGVSLSLFLIWKKLPKMPERLKNWARELEII